MDNRMIPDFDRAFESLTGFAPMKWQRRLFEKHFLKADLPSRCDLPTGLGKTSIVVIWLLALAHQAANGNVRLPRRLVYIVNRRTVVDQVTATVEQLRKRLMAPETVESEKHARTLKAVAEALRCLCASDGIPLAVSTLRGELADNEEWKADPTRPAIVVGTIDMIGSKLLFSGYGDGRYGRVHHAGLIGYDALIVHDEAHLTPAFSDLLRAVEQEQASEAKRGLQPETMCRPISVIELSATRREGDGEVFGLDAEDEADAIVQERITAIKRLCLREVPGDRLTEEIVQCAATYDSSACKVLVYVRTPDEAQKVASELTQKLGTDGERRVALLTGTMRGHERDKLVKENPVFRALLDSKATVQQTVYLVSTSAGEVGIDLDADHMVCDLTTLDALIQRLGRVNRRGGNGREARVEVVAAVEPKEKASDLDRAVDATLCLLRKWRDGAGREGVDVSPKNLRRLLEDTGSDEIRAAFSPRVPAPPLTDILLDNWSLTSIDQMPGRPEVGPFLHGLTADPPETFLVWRQEVLLLHEAGTNAEALRAWFGACRIEARERLRDRYDRVEKALKKLLGKLREEDPRKDMPVVVLDERGNASWSCLSTVRGDDLKYRTVVLPVEAGGLDANGLLSPDSKSRPDLDVAEIESGDRRRERWIHRVGPEGERFERLITGEITDAPPSGLREKERIPLRQPDENGEEAETVDLVLYVSSALSALENPETTSARQTLEEHTNSIVDHMTRIVGRLGLDEPVGKALIAAARWHDKGKDRPVWQRYARNGAGTTPLAKSPRYLHPPALGGYRHELGSLLDAMNDEELTEVPDRDLILHLIAAHHGWARPHFEARAFDSSRPTADNERAFAEVGRRFGQLQQKYGRWGLAWLESLVRCADITASQQAIASAEPISGSRQRVPEEAKP
ncbi:type I-G CRISPR-associated helicase/endonuclease Cas3g [Limisphaera sp. 4302-co]|uniref:type I-G CRISPR-associated helicase/endonuclease Cas3g n=1 Tax=Limisphaera sp. 4302-co TaxID=3400417 RepID=UPI003C1D252F